MFERILASLRAGRSSRPLDTHGMPLGNVGTLLESAFEDLLGQAQSRLEHLGGL